MRWKLAAAALFAATPAAAQTARFDWFEYRGSNPVDATLRAGPGDYRNPILGGFYPDPSVVRVGQDYYLVNSTFSWFPGIPVFHSRDLVRWTQIGNAIDRPDQLDFKQLGMSRGVFAPAIQYHAGTFYILNTCVDCGGNFVITAKNPAGPWSDPVWLPELKGGIDPSLFFDDDGRAWIVNNDVPAEKPRYDGHRAIWLQEFDPKALKTIGPRTMVIDGGADPAKNPIWIEGPHLLKKGGWYYLICAEGGTAENHSEVALRSRSITGPYLADPANPILTQRDLPADRPHPVTSSGHAQLIDTPDGDWWAVFLATQPYAGDFYNTGRETFLMPARWENGWPRITDHGQPIPYVHARPNLPRQPAPPIPTGGPMTVRDEFSGTKLAPYWMMMRNPRTRWYALDRGALVLTARPEGLGDNANPSFLARRQQHMDASAETVVRFTPRHDGDEAGLAAFQNDAYWASIAVLEVKGKRFVTTRWRHGTDQPREGLSNAMEPLRVAPGAPVHLRITAKGADYALAYATVPGRWITLAHIDGTTLSTRTAGGFIGAMFGLYARNGE